MPEFLAQMAQASTLLQPSPVFCSLLEKLGKSSNIFWSTRAMCSGFLPSWSQGTTPATSCSSVRRSKLQHGNTDISRMHMAGRRHKCWQRRDDATSIPVATVGACLQQLSPLPLLLARGFQLPPLMAGKSLAPRKPAACQEGDHVEMEEALALSAGMAALARVFLETRAASSVFFQLPVNQSP